MPAFESASLMLCECDDSSEPYSAPETTNGVPTALYRALGISSSPHDIDVDPFSFLAQYGGRRCTKQGIHNARAFFAIALNLHSRAVGQQDPDILKQALFAVAQAAAFTPEGHAELIAHLRMLGSLLLARSSRFGEPEDTTRAISVLQRVFDLTADDHPNKLKEYTNLGVAFAKRFRCFGDPEDAAQSIRLCQQSVDLTPDNHPMKDAMTGNFDAVLEAVSQCFHDINSYDLTKTIQVGQLLVDILSNDHPSKATLCDSLSTAFRARFERSGDIEHLSQSIRIQQLAVDLVSDGDTRKPKLINNLGVAFRARYWRTGNADDLSQAVCATERVADLIPDSHPDKAAYLNSLGNALQACFLRFEDPEDLAKAIRVHQRASGIISDDDYSGRVQSSNGLGKAMQMRYNHTGDIADLTGAIVAYKRTISIASDVNADNAELHGNLSCALHIRFQRLGDVDDLDQAILMCQKSFKLAPVDDHNSATRFSNLSLVLLSRFQLSDDVKDLTQAISAGQRAADLISDDHPNKANQLNNLTSLLLARFAKFEMPADLDGAVSACQRAVDIIPDDHPIKALFLTNLGGTLKKRFELTNNLEDINRAVAALQRSLDLTPDGHPDKITRQINSASALRSRLARGRSSSTRSDFLHIIELYAHASKDPAGAQHLRVNAALSWAQYCVKLKDVSRMETAMLDMAENTVLVFGDDLAIPLVPGFSDAHPPLPALEQLMSLIPLLITLDRPIHRRFLDIARQVGSNVNFAASAAIGLRKLDLAVEWLEVGRGIVRDQIFQLRTPIDDLRDGHPQLTQDFVRVARALDSPMQDQTSAPSLVEEEEASKRLKLARQFESLLLDIRDLPGFEDFLKPRRLAQLYEAVSQAGAPVIIINVHSSRSDALILSPHATLRHVRLPNVNVERIDRMHSLMMRSLAKRRASRGDQRHGTSAQSRASKPQEGEPASKRMLAALWRLIAHPILESIEDILWEMTTSRKPRVIWCPTGPLSFLPLHAAGIYEGSEKMKVSDFVVSSYIPSLSALLRASKYDIDLRPDVSPTALIVSQAESPIRDDLPILSGVAEEVEVLRACFGLAASLLENSHATVSRVLNSAKQHPWIHFACHGIQNRDLPTNSGFLLHDNLLTLSDLINTSAASRSAELAFLSACETATGDNTVPNESVHLAAGMLAAGYRGVVGTMWAINDEDAPAVAKSFYKRLLEDRKNGKVKAPETGAAYALDEAVELLRETVGDDNFGRWTPYVHLGL